MPRALIIDDSAATRSFLSGALQKDGWEVSCEADAERGAVAALGAPPDVVISDLWMPGISGLQLCRLLRDDPLTASVPIVLVSGSVDRRSRFWAARSGAQAMIDKKDIGSLSQVLSSVVDAKSTGRGSSRPQAPARPVSAASIPTRLSHLLDKALFESVVASELRGLSLSPDLPQLFEGLAALLEQILVYRWLALEAGDGGQVARCVHVHAADKQESVTEAMVALGHAQGSPDHVLCDERCARGTGRDEGPIVRLVESGAIRLGRIAIRLGGARSGSDEVAMLSLVSRELVPALRAVLLLQETQRLASIDVLTGLFNRRRGAEALKTSMTVAARYGMLLSVAMMDLDHFKHVNDTHGHAVGDLTLQHIGKVLKSTTRAADTLVRWGGEEFLVLMPSTGMSGGRIAGERIRRAIAASPVALEGGTSLEVTVSVGLATCEKEETPEELVDRADKALYAAKRRGRNRVEVA